MKKTLPKTIYISQNEDEGEAFEIIFTRSIISFFLKSFTPVLIYFITSLIEFVKALNLLSLVSVKPEVA